MKVTRIIDSFYPFMSGPAKEAFYFSSYLEKNGIPSPVYTSFLDVSNVPAEQTVENVHILRYPIKYRFMRFVYTPQMKHALNLEDMDVVHAHNYRSYQSHLGYKIARKKKIPFVINPCGGLLGYKAYLKGVKSLPYRIYDFLTRKKIILGAAKVIVESKKEFDEALKFGVHAEKIKLIPMGIDYLQYYNKSKEFLPCDSKNPLKILFVGRIARNRNLEPIIEAMRCLENVELRIVGDEAYISQGLKEGYISELQQLSKKYHLEDKIFFVGAKYDKDLINEYKSADCFVYTSLSENFGQPIQEAAAAGLPLICTRIGIALDIIVEDVTGFFVNFNSPEEIVEKLEKLKSLEKRRSMSANIQDIIKTNYSWDKIIGEYISVYEEIQ
ncbi:glycosyltransferase family 4 protein [Candidatus Lokiarchaeum ossiferum]|uniref:glycosyltransferase family 4 protein n=1 Tax=Candidatus Lokiarchaeum ossiferum TaxID=2951803 RepID=UPI00352ED23F